eukprot:9514055-Alexandrium_andersonii.AAC.1
MSASLVGSEMCIRDRPPPSQSPPRHDLLRVHSRACLMLTRPLCLSGVRRVGHLLCRQYAVGAPVARVG